MTYRKMPLRTYISDKTSPTASRDQKDLGPDIKRWWSQPVNAPPVIDDEQVIEMVRDYGFTAEQQDQLWEQCRQRDSLQTIARELGSIN